MAVACIVGYGVAGALHGGVLDALGIATLVVDPRPIAVPAHRRVFRGSVTTLPLSESSNIDLWLVCCPTADHFAVVDEIITRHGGTRLLVEKPACDAHQVGAFQSMLQSHSRARVVVSDHYQHTTAIPALRHLVTQLEPDAIPRRLSIAFTKDRRGDIARGRFVDRSYGVLGYEWLHMLTVLSQLLPREAFAEYLYTDTASIELRPTYDPHFFVAGLTERSQICIGAEVRTDIELTSSIIDTHVLVPPAPTSVSQWARHTPSPNDRHRSVVIAFDETELILQLDPVPSTHGWSLGRNRHRLVALRNGSLLHDQVILDSAFETASRRAIESLLSERAVQRVDFESLRRIARLATALRAFHRPDDDVVATAPP